MRLPGGETHQGDGGGPQNKNRAMWWRLSPTMRSPAFQAIATTAPDLPPEPGRHATFALDHEYKRHGTVSLLAGIDLLTGRVRALVKDRHRSREFIEILKLLDAAFSKLARTVLRHIRVASKQELKERIMAAMDEFNRHPVPILGPINSITPLDMIRTLETMN